MGGDLLTDGQTRLRRQAQRLGDAPEQVVAGPVHFLQRDPPDAAGKRRRVFQAVPVLLFFDATLGQPQGHAAFAHAAEAGQREQADIRAAQPRVPVRQFRVAPDERRGRDGQVVPPGVERPQRRERARPPAAARRG